MINVVDAGREAFERRSWREAFELLSSAAGGERLVPGDLVRLAMAAYLTRVDGWDDWCATAYQQCVDLGDRALAARCGFWLAFGLDDEGQGVRGGGWLARVEKLLEEEEGVERAERGLLLVHTAVAHLEDGQTTRALALFDEVCELGARLADADVVTLGCLGRGQALIEQGDRLAGLAMLDEAMVAVATREVSAPVAGLVACGAIVTCQRIFDLARATEWTSALTRWCDAQPDLVPYRGQCLVHRAEILRAHGAWPDAVAAADAACEQLAGSPAAGDALYERAEMHRLRGELTEAEESYRAASRAGRDPQPGLALLRLAQGQVAAAAAAIARVAKEATSRAGRARILGPLVEISVAAGDVAAARRAADELQIVASELDATVLHAVSASLVGRVELAEGDADAAIVTLRRAWRAWHEIGAPYEAAQVRVLIAAACSVLGDTDGAEMELDAARWVFHDLGATPDLARITEVTDGPALAGRLTTREVEVVRLVARGSTNRDVGRELYISEKTVARHLSNIFCKLGISSRSAATAWAYEQGLMDASSPGAPT